MANKFEVQVVALDRYTKVFRDLNNKASQAARPLVNVQRQVGALAREMHLDKVAKGMGKVSEAAVTVSRELGLSLGPLEAVLGAGGIVGGLLAASGAAIALGVRVAGVGFEVSRTSKAIGLSTRDLQLWRGAAELAGVDADTMTQTLTSLGRSLHAMKWGGGDPAFRQAMNILGLNDVPMKNGIVDQVAALEAISRAMSKISDPHVRESLADALHIPPEAIPALMQGAEAMERMRQKAHELGVDLDENGIKKSNEFTTSLNVLKVALEGVGNTMGSKLLPPMAQALDYMTKMISQSGRTPGATGMQGAWDAITSGPRFLRWAGSAALHGNIPTTEAERRVTGTIGDAPGGPSAPAAPPGVTRSAAEQRMAGQMGFTPEETARQNADEDSAQNRRELMREIQRTRDPAARAALQEAMNESDKRLHLEVTFKGLPAGTSATARNTADNAFVPTRISYAMPGDAP